MAYLHVFKASQRQNYRDTELGVLVCTEFYRLKPVTW